MASSLRQQRRSRRRLTGGCEHKFIHRCSGGTEMRAFLMCFLSRQQTSCLCLSLPQQEQLSCVCAPKQQLMRARYSRFCVQTNNKSFRVSTHFLCPGHARASCPPPRRPDSLLLASTMSPATMGKGDEINEISKVAKDYYDSDNAFNFYRQACTSVMRIIVWMC